MDDVIDKKVELVWLLAFYGALLTDKQQHIMRLHYEEDLSLAEIAQQEQVSRQGVHDTILRAGRQLQQFEEKLGLYARFQKTENVIDTCLASLKQVSASRETERYLADAVSALNTLKGEEEK